MYLLYNTVISSLEEIKNDKILFCIKLCINIYSDLPKVSKFLNYQCIAVHKWSMLGPYSGILLGRINK